MSSHFTPVPRLKDRHDGWTEAKQIAFIDALHDYGMVRPAAEKVGMGAASAYRLRNAPGAESFAAAWDMALRSGQAALIDIAMDRAVNGVAVPMFFKGEQVGERRWYDNRLLMFMLRQTQTRRYGRLADHYDYSDEILAAETAARERQLTLIAQAEEMRNALQAEIDALMEEADIENRSDYDDMEALQEKVGKLDQLINRMQPVDHEAELARLRAMDPGYIRSVKRKGHQILGVSREVLKAWRE